MAHLTRLAHLPLMTSLNGNRSRLIKVVANKVLTEHPMAKKIKMKMGCNEAAGAAGASIEVEEEEGGEEAGGEAGEVEEAEEELSGATMDRLMENLTLTMTPERLMKVQWTAKKTGIMT